MVSTVEFNDSFTFTAGGMIYLISFVCMYYMMSVSVCVVCVNDEKKVREVKPERK